MFNEHCLLQTTQYQLMLNLWYQMIMMMMVAIYGEFEPLSVVSKLNVFAMLAHVDHIAKCEFILELNI